MRYIICAITAGCFIMFMGSIGSAAETKGEGSNLTAHENLVAQITQGDADMRSWLGSIKPAAGHSQPKFQKKNYWEQKVNRKHRRRTAE